MTKDPKAQLRKLLGDLRYYRRELELAEQRGDEAVAASMRRSIRTEAARIRKFCEEHGLSRPVEAAEEDESA